MSVRTSDAARCKRRNTWAATVTTVFLAGASVLSSQAPVFADDKPTVPDTLYESDDQVLADQAKWTPVNDTESVMGLPTGLDNKQVNLSDVEGGQVNYTADQAIKDAQDAAKKFAEDPNTKEPARESAKRLYEEIPGLTPAPSYTAPLFTTKEAYKDPWTGENLDQICNRQNHDPARQGQKPPCAFVGKVTEKYPVKGGGGDGLAGGGKLTYKISSSVTDEKSETEGWSAGGKIAPKLSDGKNEFPVEASFTYSYASTSVKRLQNTLETGVEINVPDGKQKGWLEPRANGAYYTGYIVYRQNNEAQQRMVAVPTRVYIQARDTTSPLTWFKRVK
ncbi:hypothetical protein [Streptomyces sp. NPDC048637]|uniref:hypothetical protein n=1 Tax=Streptomyces sp. NPDC048637 TaxID=3155636 RepID=UPI00341D5B6F